MVKGDRTSQFPFASTGNFPPLPRPPKILSSSFCRHPSRFLAKRSPQNSSLFSDQPLGRPWKPLLSSLPRRSQNIAEPSNPPGFCFVSLSALAPFPSLSPCPLSFPSSRFLFILFSFGLSKGSSL
ncbi:hypothetical protein IE53DRAFT_26206 [Violaceomyces palustris]|uniref:Uncharacterized protein n=1 Tax=Violaceomyces palustris TaxID=1673888 RepID=A0ACD0P1X5_9BASI|nr:hypothetical protein IE53DRAFT_26206 [Violaceomyces palustris]